MAARTAIALDSRFNLLLLSNILVNKEGNCQHHVIIGINHGLLCVVDINSLVCCLAAGDHSGCALLIAPCWSVYLGQSSWIASLIITNRGDCCGKFNLDNKIHHIAKETSKCPQLSLCLLQVDSTIYLSVCINYKIMLIQLTSWFNGILQAQHS